MLREFSVRRIVAFVLLDWVGTLALLSVAARIHAKLDTLPGLPQTWRYAPGIIQASEAQDSMSLWIYLLVALTWPAFFVAFAVYDGPRNETLKAELLNVFQAIVVSTASLAGALYLGHQELPRTLFLAFFALDLVMLMGGRVLLWGYRRATSNQAEAGRRNVLVVGAGPVGRNVVEQLEKYAWANVHLVGYVDDDPEKQGRVLQGLPVLGTLDDMPALVAARDIKDTVVALPLRAHERLVGTCRALQGLGVRTHVVPDLFALSFPGAALDGFGGIPVIALGQPGFSGWRRLSKRAFDVTVASLTLIVTAPLMAAIAILIKRDSPGPVLFKQERVGEQGRPFTLLKFRSMRSGADTGVHRAHVTRLIEENLSPQELNGNGGGSLKLEDDPRVTRIGRFIRKGSLDELPQLINVLRGKMSLVGPRPPLAYEVEVYKDWHKRRLEALPGITGLWQIEGRNQICFDEMVRLDLKYIEQQSLWLDIKILLLTPWAMLAARGAG